MDLKNKRTLVVGSGLSGIAAVKLLSKYEANITIFDSNTNAKKEDIMGKLESGTEVNIVLGELSTDQIGQFDYVVLSPGVPTDLPFINTMRENGIPILGEIELAYQFAKGKMIAITGTNGKTTTTALVGEIMKAYFESVYVVGNIGMPYTNIALDTTNSTVTVAEMSSFQLETIDEFKPEVSAILNITPDHLNRHHTMENYIEAKINITKNQDCLETCVLNFEDETLRKAAKEIKAKVVYFSSQRELESGVFLKQNDIIYRDKDTNILVCSIHELKLLGTHNYENVMAAIAMSVAIGVPMESIRKTIMSFVAVEHRIEYVAEKKGVKYYNDSKGTNPDAAIKGIKAMITPTLLIGGGYDKGSEYEEWIQAFDGKVKYLVLLGQTKEKIADTARECGFTNIVFAQTLKEAVEFCSTNAKEGDSVLLSPACASWGMFKDYEERGRMFKEYVQEII